MAKGTAVVSPNLGLHFDRPPFAMDQRMLQDGLNFRIREGKISNFNTGWVRFGVFQLNGPVLLIDNFFPRNLGELLIFASKTDLYLYQTSGGGTVRYLTPAYTTGTASASGTAVTGVGTSWLANVKAGDQISFGSATQTSVSATWFTVQTVNSDTSITLTASAGTIGSGSYTIRRVFTGDEGDQWITDKFLNAVDTSNNDLWFATNGVDPVITWNGTDTFATRRSSLGFTCKALRAYSNMMIYMNVVQGGASLVTDMINSDVSRPLTIAGGLASQFKVHEGSDGILNAKRLGDNLVIYSKEHVTVAQFVGDPLIFTFRQAVIGKGPLGAKAIATFPDHHLFLGRDIEYRFDGAATSAINHHVWRQKLRERDPSREGLIYNHLDPENGDLIWVMGTTLDSVTGVESAVPNFALTEHYLEGGEEGPQGLPNVPYSRRDFPFYSSGYFSRATGVTWADLTAAWQTYTFRWSDNFFAAGFPLSIAGDGAGKVYVINQGQTKDGVAQGSFIKLPRRALGDGRMRGLLKRLYLFMTYLVFPVGVQIAFFDSATGAVQDFLLASLFQQTYAQGAYYLPVYRRARYFELLIASTSTPWEFEGYDLMTAPGGRR